MRYLLLICLILTGCGMPQTAQATRQADQAVEAIGIMIAQNAEVVNKIDNAEQREKLQLAFQKIGKLVQATRISLQPAITYLSDGKEIKLDTTPEQAVKDTDAFVMKANIQAGKAAVEVEDRLSWTSLFLSFVDPSNLEGWLVGLSTALFGSGAAGLVAVRILRTIRTYKTELEQHKEAVVDAVAFGRRARELDPKDEKTIEDFKANEAKKQQARGTKPIIDAALTRIKNHGQNT
jgi:hypothetical protein